MFSTVSWSQYITVLIVATIIYYLFVWVIYFKAKLSFLPGLSDLPSFIYAEDSPDEMTGITRQVVDELRPLFRREANRNELLFGLQQQLSKYTDCSEPGFREKINQYISRQCGTLCSIRLSEEEVSALWK